MQIRRKRVLTVTCKKNNKLVKAVLKSIQQLDLWCTITLHLYSIIGDLEDNQPVSWSRDATELLISLYEDYEQELEDPRIKRRILGKR